MGGATLSNEKKNTNDKRPEADGKACNEEMFVDIG